VCTPERGMNEDHRQAAWLLVKHAGESLGFLGLLKWMAHQVSWEEEQQLEVVVEQQGLLAVVVEKFGIPFIELISSGESYRSIKKKRTYVSVPVTLHPAQLLWKV